MREEREIELTCFLCLESSNEEVDGRLQRREMNSKRKMRRAGSYA